MSHDEGEGHEAQTHETAAATHEEHATEAAPTSEHAVADTIAHTEAHE